MPTKKKRRKPRKRSTHALKLAAARRAKSERKSGYTPALPDLPGTLEQVLTNVWLELLPEADSDLAHECRQLQSASRDAVAIQGNAWVSPMDFAESALTEPDDSPGQGGFKTRLYRPSRMVTVETTRNIDDRLDHQLQLAEAREYVAENLDGFSLLSRSIPE